MAMSSLRPVSIPISPCALVNVSLGGGMERITAHVQCDEREQGLGRFGDTRPETSAVDVTSPWVPGQANHQNVVPYIRRHCIKK